MEDELPTLTAYMDTGVFGPHRWMIRGAPDDNHLSRIQFTSEHDAKTAIAAAHAYGQLERRALRARINKIADDLW